jgi:hypothetical protein
MSFEIQGETEQKHIKITAEKKKIKQKKQK